VIKGESLSSLPLSYSVFTYAEIIPDTTPFQAGAEQKNVPLK
jgi:hypothetical protein